MITIKSPREIALMREAGRIVSETFTVLAKAIKPGVTTIELDRLAENFIRQKHVRPAFKGLYNFPASICTSVNEEVVHGIPGQRKLKEGDIISIDLGVELNGYFGDGARTFPVGEISADAKALLKVTREALAEGISNAQAENRLFDISHAIQSYVEGHGFSVVRDYVGHGIGRAMHEEPQVPNYGKPGRGLKLVSGMTLAIEPMVNAGTHAVRTLADNWTVVTLDGKLSAHFEHTVLVLNNKPEILTAGVE